MYTYTYIYIYVYIYVYICIYITISKREKKHTPAADGPPLRRPVALAAAGVDGLVALIVLVWLITGSLPDDVDGLGKAILIALVVLLGAFALLEARVATQAPGTKGGM